MRSKLVMLLVVFSHPIAVRAQGALDQQQRNEIGAILRKPAQVYELDAARNKVVFDRIDAQFARQFDFSKATSKQGRSGIQRYKLLVEKNVPIFVTEGTAEGLAPPKAFYARYEKGPQRRAFKKELAVPALRTLDEKTAIALADGWVKKNALCVESDLDAMASPSVASLRRQRLDGVGKPADKMTLLHRVEFKRKVTGLEVINSKQVVELHPTTREVLGYESLNWTPIVATSGKQYPYLSLDETVAQIESQIAKSRAKRRVTSVRAAMFQDEKYVFPVLVVGVESPQGDTTGYVFKGNLVVALVKNIPSERKPRPLRHEPTSIKR